MEYLSEHNILLFLIQFGTILALSKLISNLFLKINQPTITGDLIIGLILGPTILGRFFPTLFKTFFPINTVQLTMLDTIAWTGILFLMLQAGMEINFESVWKQRNHALIISLSDIFLPMLIAFFPIFFLPDRYLLPGTDRILFSLFIASIMTISALPVAIRVLYDLKILKTDLGVLIVSALTINDIIGWLFFTVILGIYSKGQTEILFIIKILLLTVTFTIAALSLGKKLSNKIIEYIHTKNSNPSSATITYVCLLGILFGTITLKIGIHSLFGFFLAGLIVGQSKLLKEKDRQFFNDFVHSIFVPIFFVNIGLKLDFIANFDLLIVSLISFLGIAGRFIGAFIGSLSMKKNIQDSTAIGLAHTPGGEMHIVVGILAYESGLIYQSVFIAIIIGAIVSSILFGPLLSLTYKLAKKHSIKQLFKLNHIFVNLDLLSKDDYLDFLCTKASKIMKIDKNYLLTEVQNREKILSSALGKNLSIPHARLKEIDKPYLFFAKSQKGIDWDAPDGKLVNNIFLIFTPANDTGMQLKILSAIAKIFQDTNKCKIISDSNDNNSIYKQFKKLL
ncbi:MAG: cation:proton antiporter [Candidatus Cloacimonetes bacterium]|nr:cation:proton antiporter [Candidatus Cloacimonadota bacterium]